MDESGGLGDPEAQNLIPLDSARQSEMPVMFDRRELMTILNLYSRMVAAGEWKDYAIDSLKDCAVFSVFRRASETPLFRIEKTPRLARNRVPSAWSMPMASSSSVATNLILCCAYSTRV